MPSRTVETLIDLVSALPEATIQDLTELLRYDIAEQRLSPGTPASRLGLLSLVIPQLKGQLPSVIAYDEARRNSGAAWPSGSQLARDYGGWLRALRAAEMLAAGDRPYARIRQPSGGSYSQREALLELVKCREQIGAWPATSNEYSRWAQLARTVANRWGSQPARVPSVRTLDRLFGDFTSAVHAAKDWCDQGEQDQTIA